MNNWRTMYLGAAILVYAGFLGGCEQRSKPAVATQQPRLVSDGTIVAVGDSLTAGLGVREEEAYPALLEKKLREAGYNWSVINAGISGETSSGTLSRISWILKLKPVVVILETGANDGIRGINPAVTGKNIDETIRILKQNNVVVVLAGMKMFTNLGRTYTDAFAATYPAVAARHNIILEPFFLEGVAGIQALTQADGIHPTAEGYRIITKTLYPYVLESIRRYGDRKKSL